MRSIFFILTVATAYALLRGWPEDLHPVLRSCFAVLLLVLGIGMWRRRERPPCNTARAVRAPRWPDYLAIGLGVLGIECLFLFFLSVVPQHAENASEVVVETFFPGRAAERKSSREEAHRSHGTTISGNWLWDSQGRRGLPLSSNARPSNKPEIFFRPTDSNTTSHLLRNRVYLRAFALEKFDYSTWSPVGMVPATLFADDRGFINLEQPGGRPGPLLQGEVIQPANPGGEDVFTSPQGATRGRVGQLRHVDPGIYRLNPAEEPGRGYTYQVAARTVTLTGLLESGVLDEFRFPPLPSESHLLELPTGEALRDEIINLSSKTLRDPASRLVGLRKLLWQNYEYSLEIVNPDGIDPLLNFMRDEKRGHCEFFATAGALLCRALNIPSRIAYGWSGGKWYAGPGYFMFRAREAHAWTEIYLENVGWVVFDTTPPGSRTRIDIATAGEELPIDQQEDLPLASEPGFQRNFSLSLDPGSLWLGLALFTGLLLLPLSFVILRFRRRPTGIPGTTSTDLLPEEPGYLNRFKHHCARKGHPMPPGRTLQQQLAILSEQDARPPFADDLLNYHYAVTYRDESPSKVRESSLLRAIRQWA
ncbi:MAG: hypothetical protein CMO40_00470 [Verrucomicrobiaceae bacterium]|nr:hypothetical protein [Verrucomicrobiaceae bacterium]